jgi:hypothetical protein
MNGKVNCSLLTVCILLTGGCRARVATAPTLVSIVRKFELGGAESTQVSVAIGFGDLTVSGGAEGALDARFDYDVPDWKPEVTYAAEDGLGRLTVRQPSSDAHVQAKDVRYHWDLRLSDQVPVDLTIEMGAGKVKLDTRGMKLRRLKVAAGVGEGNIDLTAVRTDLTAKVEAGIGKLVLLVPADVGVRIKADGIGQVHAKDLTHDEEGWKNAAWGKSEASIRVDIGGIGQVEAKSVSKETI